MAKNVLDKADEFVKLVQRQLPRMDKDSIRGAVSRLNNHFYYKKKTKKYKPSAKEMKICEIMIREGLSPSQVYKWLLLMDSDPEIRELLRQKKISIKNAFKKMNEARFEEYKMTVGRIKLRSDIEEAFKLYIHPRIGTP